MLATVVYLVLLLPQGGSAVIPTANMTQCKVAAQQYMDRYPQRATPMCITGVVSK